MKASFLSIVSVLVCSAIHSSADEPELPRAKLPGLAAPAWLEFVDQGKNDPRLEGYRTPKGIQLEIVADAPLVVNPVGLAFGPDGLPYVLQWRKDDPKNVGTEEITFEYKDGSTRKVTALKKKVKDVVQVLLDEDGDGKYDKAKTVLEAEFPSSLLFHDGWLYVSGRGSVRRHKQSKPDGPYDVKEVILQGFGGVGHQQVSGMTLGNDGQLYVTVGAGDHYVEGSDGSRAMVLRSGAVFRCRPNGAKVQTFSLGYFNPYRDVTFDSLGNMFHADNDSAKAGKFAGCRLMHVVQGSDFGWRADGGKDNHSADPVRASTRGEKLGKVPPMHMLGRGAPSGLFCYNDTRLPFSFQGLLYYPDMIRQTVRAYGLQPKGATFEVAEEFVFLESKDPLFRPCQMVLGPDGAIYLVDWRTDLAKSRTLWGDATHGRIYRVLWTGTDDVPALALRPTDSLAKLVELEDKELIAKLSDVEESVRQSAQRELIGRGNKNKKALLEVLQSIDALEPTKLATLGVLLSMWDADVQKMCELLLIVGDAGLRRQAADALALYAEPKDKKAHEALLRVLGDEDLAVRRAVIVAMGQVKADGAADILASTLAFDDTKDVYLRDGIVRAIEALGKDGMDRLLALAESGVEENLLRVVRTLRMVRTREGAAAIPRFLKYPHLTIEQRAALIDAYNNFLLDPAVSLDPIVEYMNQHPDEALQVKRAVVNVLAKALAVSPKASTWLSTQLDDEDLSLRLAILETARKQSLTALVPKLRELSKEQKRSAEERAKIHKTLDALTTKTKEE